MTGGKYESIFIRHFMDSRNHSAVHPFNGMEQSQMEDDPGAPDPADFRNSSG